MGSEGKKTQRFLKKDLCPMHLNDWESKFNMLNLNT